MVDNCAYTQIGMALDLLAQSKFHQRFATGLYIHIEILPPIKHSQTWFLIDDEGIAIAMVTWAKITSEILEDIVATGRSIYAHEWNTGDTIFINDFVSPTVPALKVIRSLKDNRVFGEKYSFTSLRRHMDVSVRKVNRWTNREVLVDE